MNEHAQTGPETVSVRILITGKVQGVGFRQAARQQARKLGIETSALNRHDGSVLLETTGPREVVAQLVEWARRGPSLAKVQEVTVINTRRSAQSSV